jgi:hypothetical protein
MMEFSASFTVIGEDQAEQTDDIAAFAPGRAFSIDQDLFEEQGGAWNRPGDPVGEAHGSGLVTRKGLAMCHITFTFGPDDIIIAHGVLPLGGKDVGAGLLAVAGGTGQFHKALGRCDVEVQNPKRWIFTL